MPINVRLLQIADSALPISGYTHSWGLESAVAAGRIHDAASLERWTANWLQYSLGPFEGVLVASACRLTRVRDGAAIWNLNRLAETSLAPPTIRGASREMGEQMMALSATWSWSRQAVEPFLREYPEGWHHPVVFGLLAAIAQADPQDALAAYLHQSALGVISAGARIIPVGHTHAQQALAYLDDDILPWAARFAQSDPESAGAGCPFYEVLCDEQTRLYARVYRS